MNSRIPVQRPAVIKSTAAIILMSLFLFTSCKKDDVKVSANTTVSAFSPGSGPEGTIVIISGTNFSTALTGNTVTFNGSQAAVSGATAGQITATVPSGATTGTIVVTVAGSGGSATSGSDFIVTP